MRRFAAEDRGQAIVLITIVMGTLLLGIGIAIDAGQLYVARRAAQTAADSASWAGAVVIHGAGASGFSAATATAAEAAAIADAARNGHAITTADVNVPPTSGAFREDPGFVEVILTTSVPTTFFPGPRTVTVRSVAGASRSGAGSAVHVLRTGNVASTLNLSSSGRLDVTGGGIQVESSSSGGAVNIASGGISTPGFATRIVGNPGISGGDAARVSPAPIGNSPSIPDPFASLPGPSTTALYGAAYGTTPAVLTEKGTVDRNNNNAPLDPGIYTGGIRIRGSSNVTLNPGVYILRGGGADHGLTVSGTAGVNMASATAGVVIFNTYSNYPAAPGGSPNCGRITLSTSGQVTLRPGSAGSYAGIVIYQDRSCPTGDVMASSGSGERSITGTVYLPNTALQVSDAAQLSWTAQLVVREYDGDGTDLNLTFTPAQLAGGRVPALVD